MAAENLKNYLVMLKICIQRFIESPITNLTLGFKDSMWRIQDGDKQMKKSSNFTVNLFTKVIWVADYEFDRSRWRIHCSC